MRLFKPILLGGLGWIAMLGASVAFAQVSYRLQEPRAAPLPGQPPIDVVFSLPADSYHAHSGIVVLTITNQSDQVIYMPIWLTPTSGIAPKETELPRRLMNPVLDVVNKDGRFSPYMGRAYSLIVDEDHPENNAWLYQELRPGQVISKEVDVAKDYDVTGGGYFKLSYMQFYGGPDVVLRDGNPLAYKAWSNELEIWINPNMSTLGSFGALDPDDVSLMQCTPRRSAILWGANSMAHVWLQESVWKSFPLYKVRWGFDSVNAELNQDDKYMKWFGQPFNNLEPVEDYKERSLMSPPVWGHPDFRPLRLAYAAMNRGNKVKFDCGCRDEGPLPVAAWAYSARPYHVVICNFFFELPLVAFGYASQVGTLVHEYSHFDDEWASFQSDVVYGRQKVRELARDDHQGAVTNADNFGFWVEDINYRPKKEWRRFISRFLLCWSG